MENIISNNISQSLKAFADVKFILWILKKGKYAAEFHKGSRVPPSEHPGKD